MSKDISSPIIFETKYNRQAASSLDQEITSQVTDPDQQNFLINFPTVYIINQNQRKTDPQYTVYVGETNDIQRRTLQHLDIDPRSRQDWKQFADGNNARMYVIGHQHFNKSLTLDIENRMMHYLSGVSTVAHLNNRRENAQNDYYPADEMVPIFNRIWRKLHHKLSQLFQSQRLIEESALFKASPFHKLTKAQLQAKNQILTIVDQALRTNQQSQLVLVEGEAGAGKTVLMSNIFYDLATRDDNSLSVAMMVNHRQQEKVYEQIVAKLGLHDNAKVIKTTTFINQTSPTEPIDIAFVDEAHLLLTQRSQAYYGHGTNELLDIVKRARVVVAVYDEHQILHSSQIIEADDRAKIEQLIDYRVELKNQMRIDASPAMVAWLRNMIDNQRISKAPYDPKYDLRVFDDPAKMQAAIQQKARVDGENGISRMLATFDWPYSSAKKQDYRLWEVSEGDWHMPWNLQVNPNREDKRQISGVKYSDLSWAEQPHTIKEIGSTYTIQGSDLNYAGVEIGPSVKYRRGKIVFDPDSSSNKKAIQNRKMHDDSKQNFAEQLLKNELNVLLTRGVHGLYLHAVDPALQKALKKAVKNK
ncbi:DUF2075 domain-containing protein [Limosilactobacillus caecicola]|uniref:DUF2075 domain-containing protein n=1 Tax=Limosilactobacillus caecicola TaxID=2941332 RepID=UPI00203B0745|nr:DUF2075 domain-containing protein [Limosilactobacillus caecicola]